MSVTSPPVTLALVQSMTVSQPKKPIRESCLPARVANRKTTRDADKMQQCVDRCCGPYVIYDERRLWMSVLEARTFISENGILVPAGELGETALFTDRAPAVPQAFFPGVSSICCQCLFSFENLGISSFSKGCVACSPGKSLFGLAHTLVTPSLNAARENWRVLRSYGKMDDAEYCFADALASHPGTSRSMRLESHAVTYGVETFFLVTVSALSD